RAAAHSLLGHAVRWGRRTLASLELEGGDLLVRLRAMSLSPQGIANRRNDCAPERKEPAPLTAIARSSADMGQIENGTIEHVRESIRGARDQLLVSISAAPPIASTRPTHRWHA